MVMKDIGTIISCDKSRPYRLINIKASRLFALRVRQLKADVRDLDRLYNIAPSKELIDLIKYKRNQIVCGKLLAESFRFYDFTKCKHCLSSVTRFVMVSSYGTQIPESVWYAIKYYKKEFRRSDRKRK